MDRESYDNPEVAAFINENFVPVKVDRDERPVSAGAAVGLGTAHRPTSYHGAELTVSNVDLTFRGLAKPLLNPPYYKKGGGINPPLSCTVDEGLTSLLMAPASKPAP